jgi:hypothetical protein
MRLRNSNPAAVAAGAVLLLAVGALPTRAGDSRLSEYQVKALDLFNFTKFVDWPAGSFADDRSPFGICVLGDDPFGKFLDQILEGEQINGRKLAIQRLRRVAEPKSCQILFVSGSEKEVARTLASLGPGVLTVGEGEAFRRAGGVITFVLENRRVRFDINQRAAGSARLVISSRLLKVARTVER